MAGEWSTGLLADVAASIQTGPFGSQLHASDYVPSGVPVVMPTNIRDRRIDTEGISFIGDDDADRLSRHKLRLHDLVFSRRGEVDKCALVTKDTVGWLCGTGCLLVRPDEKKCDPAFLSFHISAPDTREWLKQHAVGLVMPNLNTEILSSIPLNLPPLGEQRRIADLLSSLDDKIELNRRMAATLEEMARALFKSWFVDFDPVRAKAEGRDPGLPAATAALFPDRFGEDGLPVGWELTEINRFFNLVGGGTPTTSIAEYWQGDIPWFSVADAPSASAPFILETERSISVEGLQSCASPLLPVGSTIITARGTVGKMGIVGTPMAFNQSCYAAIPSAGLGPYFVYYLLADAILELARRSHGSVFSTITRQTFEGLLRPFGQPQLASCFDALVAPIMSGVCERLRQSQTLTSLRDTLLPKLISGELRIKDMGKDEEAA